MNGNSGLAIDNVFLYGSCNDAADFGDQICSEASMNIMNSIRSNIQSKYFPSEKMRELDRAIPVRMKPTEPAEANLTKLESYYERFIDKEKGLQLCSIIPQELVNY